MSITTSLNRMTSNMVNNSVKSSASASPVSPTSNSSAETSKTENGFADMFAQAVNAVPSQPLSPEVLQATLPTTTIQTSNYVFDPLGVVGTIPESNTFLQAIRQMMGKPFEAAATPVIAAKAEPAASTPATPTPAVITPPAATSTNDFLDSLEAQLNYQGLSTTTVAATATATSTPTVTPTATSTLATTASNLLSQYMGTDIQTTLVDALNQKPEEQAI